MSFIVDILKNVWYYIVRIFKSRSEDIQVLEDVEEDLKEEIKKNEEELNDINTDGKLTPEEIEDYWRNK